MARSLAVSLASIALAVAHAAPSAQAEPPDWNGVAEVGTVRVVTTNEDGTARDTTIWLVVLDGQGYIRTANTRWGRNVERDPDMALVIEEAEYALRVEFVEDDDERERITRVYREKYGWVDGFLNVLRGSRPKIMRLHPRE